VQRVGFFVTSLLRMTAHQTSLDRPLLSSVLVIAVTFLASRAVTNLLAVRFKDRSHVHTFRMLVRSAILVLGSVSILFVWFGAGSSFTVAMGILGAGIAFASQEVIGSFAGYLSIVTRNLFRIGDGVGIGNVVGDVLDISLLRTTVIEIAEWLEADQ